MNEPCGPGPAPSVIGSRQENPSFTAGMGVGLEVGVGLGELTAAGDVDADGDGDVACA